MDESPTRPGEWGFRPSGGQATEVNPPAFVWRPQEAAKTYELACSRDRSFGGAGYRAGGITYNVHCPPRALATGEWFWRFRYQDDRGILSPWSQVRSFVIQAGAVKFPMPTRKELLARIPKRHPRMFIRPGQLPHLRELARGKLKAAYGELIKTCEGLLKRPPSTKEPPKYPPQTVELSEQWREFWWGNCLRATKLLDGAATLAFTRLLSGREEYGQLAKKILLAAADWDPIGASGYRYNDEAGMPYNHNFSRTYSFLNDLLSEQEKEKCRNVMAIRGREMYEHLRPVPPRHPNASRPDRASPKTGGWTPATFHLWHPYGSHRNRAWHFLGEIGVAFLDEIPDAAEWVWFAMNVFYSVYPAWCDSDGGWHDGSSYWESYMSRFAWWADVMRAAMGIEAYAKPYFSQIGYYPIYVQPPGTPEGGFGDLSAKRPSSQNVELMTMLAARAQNPHWQWYVDAHGGPRPEGGYVGFVRPSMPHVKAKPPTDLPTSRCFRGTGQAMMNTNLLSARRNVEVVFKSSPFGTASHGYDAQNTFLLYAFGKPLLVPSGTRDIWGSDHHVNWMWHTKSTNGVTVDGEGQGKHTMEASGEILAFHTSDALDFVSGEAAGAYAGKLSRFTRSMIFVKPELIVVYDRLEAPAPVMFDWWLHSPTEMKINGQADIRVVNGNAACLVSFLAPSGLELSLTNRFDPPPRPRVKLVQWHLTARPACRAERAEFVTLIRPHRTGKAIETGASLHRAPGGYAVEADLTGGKVLLLLRAADQGAVEFKDVSARADVATYLYDKRGTLADTLFVEGKTVRVR